MGVAERVTDVVTPHLSARGLQIYDVEHSGGTLRVLVESSDPALASPALDVLADASREISRALDDVDPIPGRYTLEVSSPGLERRLRTVAHFRGALGSEVTVRLNAPRDGQRRFEGMLSDVDDDGIVIDGIGFDHDEIAKARTVFRWGPAPKPRRGQTTKPSQGEKTESRS